ncbi:MULTISPECIES: FHA domain-containing protein [unclassified Streptomyces]|uniref:FHA domain-containing protein n=1 Tax=unclassified Streptomyces TaxID=2593676 RepID=UPI002E0E7AC5|nr:MULTISPECIES: FHA domain-containing protein [unclassified Streptomyces]WSJ22582.1 FHA domain-containing protein [Streptomyces sp. NBC_01324]
MPTCPNGHQSGSEDWCEVCGHRVAGAAVPPPPPPPPAPGYGYPPSPGPDATAQADICPQCRTPREAMAPFCEECRWNFLTNTATSYTPLAPQHGGPSGPPGPGGPGPGIGPPQGFPGQQPPGPPQPRDPFEYQGSRPSQVNRPAEPLSSGPGQPGPGQPPFPGQHGQQGPPPPPPFQQGPGQGPQGQHGQQNQQGFPSERQGFPQGQQGFPQGQQHAQQQGSSQGSPPPPSFQQSAAPAFQQTAPPVFDPPAPPPPPQAERPGNDDWMLSPPAQPQAPQPPMQQQPYPGQNQGPGMGQDQGPGQVPGQGQGPGQGPGQASTSWAAVVAPDRDYFLAMMQRSGPEATGLNLPAYSPEQHLPLTGSQITIGRRRHSTGESPDIDLSVPPEDPGVSHQHAVLVQQPDSSWAVVDQNSTNGTTLNGAEDPIQPYVPVPLQDGDQVHVGAWTTITIRRG